MEIDMNLITYHCDYSNQWFVYDDNYADDYTPHGVGYSVDEAIESLKDTMEVYFEKYKSMEDWNLWLEEINKVVRR
jgi:predicted RNase H-like HicB family nuclease